MELNSTSLATRREFVAAMTATTVLVGSGCLGAQRDEQSDISESHLTVANDLKTEQEVNILIENRQNDERLINEQVTVPTDDLLYFDFTSEPDEDGDYPDIFARVSMVNDEENRDSEIRSFPPSAGASYAAVIKDSGEITMYVDNV